MKISKNWLKMAEVYRIFSLPEYDFSPQAMEEAYKYESIGTGEEIGIFTQKINGYMYGKKMLNITVSMWKEDIKKGLLFMTELYDDPKLPHWWLNKIFDRKYPPLKLGGTYDTEIKVSKRLAEGTLLQAIFRSLWKRFKDRQIRLFKWFKTYQFRQ